MAVSRQVSSFRYSRMWLAVCCCLLFVFSAHALAVSKCVAADGSVSYVQGNCPQLDQKKEDVRVWDSGKGMKIGPDLPVANDAPASRESRNTASRGPGHPCNATTGNVVQRRLETQACAVLSRPHDPKNPACRTLATGSWKHQATMTVPEFRAMIAHCQATAGSPNATDNARRPRVEVGARIPQRAQECFKAEIIEPVPFLGKRDELFQLSDGSVWQVTDGYLYLYAYNPQIIVCPSKGQAIIEEEVISVRRVGQ